MPPKAMRGSSDQPRMAPQIWGGNCSASPVPDARESVLGTQPPERRNPSPGSERLSRSGRLKLQRRRDRALLASRQHLESLHPRLFQRLVQEGQIRSRQPVGVVQAVAVDCRPHLAGADFGAATSNARAERRAPVAPSTFDTVRGGVYFGARPAAVRRATAGASSGCPEGDS